MRKIFSFLLVIIVTFLFYFDVNAVDYDVKVLIPVDTNATVKTEKFSYNDLVYNSQIDAKGNSLITFNSIHNLTISKVPVSINILLFDGEKRNIGFLTYCSDRDISSNYAGFKLLGSQSAPFSIVVTDKYFSEGKLPVDVRYIAILDDNKYCKIGGYDKYAGLTIDEIVNGFVGKNNKYSFTLSSIIMDLVEKFGIDKNGKIILQWIIYIMIACIVLTVIGKVLNLLNRKIYAQKTTLAYLPITNVYVASKLVFGKIIAVIYIIIYVISIFLYFVIGPFLLIVNNFIALIIFLLVILKLITRKYDLFYYEPTVKINNYNNSLVNNNQKSVSKQVKENENSNMSSQDKFSNDVSIKNTSSNNVNNANQVLVDLTYSDKYDSNEFNNASGFEVENIGNNSNNTNTRAVNPQSDYDNEIRSTSSIFNSNAYGMMGSDDDAISGDKDNFSNLDLDNDSNSANNGDYDDDDFYDSLDDE